MIKILKRKINKSEAELLVEQIKLTPNIMGYSLKEWMSAENIMVAENEDGKLLGACLSYDFHEDWNKIAALFVLEEFRGRGIGKLLFYESVNDAMVRHKNVYTISANPILIGFEEYLNFVMFKNFGDLSDAYQEYKFIFYVHSIKWAMNLYRIQEIIRKTIFYNSKQPFVYGVKFCKQQAAANDYYPVCDRHSLVK